MYDPETAALLRSAPELPDLNPADLPRLLTSHYAQLVSVRLGGNEQQTKEQDYWTLDRIADTYELIASINVDPSIRRPSAFVAASAQLIIARRDVFTSDNRQPLPNISRDRLAPELAAVLLFLSAEQYADALEAASQIPVEHADQLPLASVITDYVRFLAKGRLSDIISRGIQRTDAGSISTAPNEYSVTEVMLQALAKGIELLAMSMLGKELTQADSASPRAIFEQVKMLAVYVRSDEIFSRVEYSYPGIHHLASLLISTYDGISAASLTKLSPPEGSDIDFWNKWIKFRANKFPYIWPNHRKALAEGFHKTGISAVVVLPTGAGKTTVSSIKIANVLAQGKKVVFLAPTHALVEQLTSDLQDMFPKDILGSAVSNDFDLLFQLDVTLPEIEVMTPERCLAMLSFSPDSFNDVGLLVFDECHILSPQSGKIRRSLDSMLCLLAFNRITPSADILFLSAMVKNGKEFSEWITQLTKRQCISIDLLWKPSRQARGVVIYKENDLHNIKNLSLATQNKLDQEKGKKATSMRAAASKELLAKPYAIWGLQHNWLDMEKSSAICTYTRITESTVPLSGGLRYTNVALKPNVNEVSSKIAVQAARNNIKAIVFVNQKSHAISTSIKISNELGLSINPTVDEEHRWQALELELGDLKHSLLTKGNAAVPHNASMLRIERDLSERMYKREDGARVIVATPTLAQGLNLPAQIAILAGDKRAELNSGGRESLEAHELLNAAARAGRAGHLANGIVLLVPEPVLSFPENQLLNENVVQKLQALIPEDDRCVEIYDPISVILDRISAGDTIDNDVIYMVNRLTTLDELESDNKNLFNLQKSFAAFRSKQKGTEQHFNDQLNELTRLVEMAASDDIDESLSILASQSGLPPLVLARLKSSIEADLGSLPSTITEWVIWLIHWLKTHDEIRDILLFDVGPSILGAVGRKKDAPLTNNALDELQPGIISWISGLPLKEIELALGGEPDSTTATKKSCPRARELVSSVLPRGLSFIMGLITRVVSEIEPYEHQEDLSAAVVDSLSAAIRLGYDTPEKLSFSFVNSEILSRVGMHLAFKAQ